MDTIVFRFINQTLRNPFFDQVLPLFSDKDYVVIPGVVLAGVLIFFGGRCTRLCLLALIPAILISDLGSEKVFKNMFGELRPYASLSGVHLHRGGQWIEYDPAWYALDARRSFGFPSTHAANVAAVAVVLAFFSRRTLWVTTPIVLLVGLSRVYTGNHYPSDVLAGHALGIFAGSASVLTFLKFGTRWMEQDTSRVPWTALHPSRKTFYLTLGAWTLFNFGFLHLNLFDLAGDEAQYWDWSRRLALGYYSKPPLIAYVIAALVGAGGNQEWAIRSGAVICTSLTLAFIYALTLRIAKNERTALLAALITLALPVLWAGSVLMTIDPLLCVFWAAALYTFHRAVNGDPEYWWAVGLCLGLGALAKYTMLLLFPVFGLYLLLVDRSHWSTRGPYLALTLAVVCMSGVIYWNWTHDWVSIRHTASIGAGEVWTLSRSLRQLGEYFGSQLGVASPVLFVLMVWAAIACLPRMSENRDTALLGLAFFAIFGAYAVVAVVRSPEPNWPVCAYIAGAPALAWVWRKRGRGPWLRGTLVAGLVLGCVMGLALRATGLIYVTASPLTPEDARQDRLHLAGWTIDPNSDPTNALRGGRELGAALSRHMGTDPKTAPFPFSDRYQLTAWSAFYTVGRPRAYCMNIGNRRHNQYDLWGGWEQLTGRDGLFVTGGDALKTQLFVKHMVDTGAFESGELLDTMEVVRGRTVIKKFSIALMHTYSGNPWTVEKKKF